MIDWQPFLAHWSRELMQSELAGQVAPPPGSPEWLGFVAATAEEVAELEHRLGLILPPSYKSFLFTSNGWRRTTPFISRIRPADEVDWFRVENEQWVEAYAACDSPDEDREYYRYEDGSAAGLRAQHLPSLVQISDVDDGVYLLNPRAVTPDGEWEAWFFANWIPGATRYSSFAHLMVQEYRSFVETEMPNGSDFELPALPTHAPNVPRTAAKRASAKRSAAKRAPRRVSKSPPLMALIEQMGASDVKSRHKAVRTFVGHLQGRRAAKHQADLVKRLIDLFYASTDESVRCACLEGITEFADDGPLPQPLFDALSDPDPAVVLAGVSALSYFPDSRAVEPVCRLIESRENANFYVNAMLVLGEFGDERAVPALSKALLDTLNPLDQTFAIAALALARCGPSGFDTLVAALDHVDARIRHAAVAALDSTGDPRAAAYLDRMGTDPDPRVRDRATIRVGKPYGWQIDSDPI